jgi:microcystin degradation protein MlrC
VARSDALIAYRTYPHVDMAETGARCLPVIERLLAGERLPKAFRRGGFLIGLPWQCTLIEPGRALYVRARALEAEAGGPVSVAMGFPAADTECCGPSFFAYGPGAEAAVAELERLYAASEPGFAGRLWDPAAAVAEAMRTAAGRPVVLADTQDNPGGGGTGDTTSLLRALIEARAEGAVLALMCDPAAAAAAHAIGLGGTLPSLPVGGRNGPPGVEPVIDDWRVVALGDGHFTATGPFYGGNRMALGPMAALQPLSAPGMRVLVATRRVQAADQAMLRHLGMEPAAQRILALKSSVHFRADFEPIAHSVLVVEAPGLVTADPGRLRFARLPAGLLQSPRPANA